MSKNDVLTLDSRRSQLFAKPSRAQAQPIWEPAPPQAQQAPSTTTVLQQIRDHRSELGRTVEEELLSVLRSPVGPYETSSTAAARREGELVHVIRSLTVMEAYELDRRLRIDRSGDVLVEGFRRLSAERRQRLRNLLESHRRQLMHGAARAAM